MRVSDPRLSREGSDRSRLEFEVGDFTTWFEVVGHEISEATIGTVALAAGLLPAMREGTSLVLPTSMPLAPSMAAAIPALVELYLAWADSLGIALHPVTVEAPVGPEPSPRDETLSFFSGGVDGCSTALRHRETITALVLVRGIDLQLESAALWDEALQGVGRIAAHLGMPLVEVHSNIRFLGYAHGLKWALHYQAAALAAIAHLLGPRQMLLAASHAATELEPFGSHPLLDPLWSSATTAIVHDGPEARTAKLARLIDDEVIMANLRVCWHDRGYNCGTCEKCLRTMVAIHLLGGKAVSFPTTLDWSDVARLAPSDQSDWCFFEELVRLERERPDPRARRALAAVARRRDLRAGLKRLDAALTGGRLFGRAHRRRG